MPADHTTAAALRLLAFALLALLLGALAACGGGDAEPPPEPCVSTFVGPLQPGQLPPDCQE